MKKRSFAADLLETINIATLKISEIKFENPAKLGMKLTNIFYANNESGNFDIKYASVKDLILERMVVRNN